MGAKGDPGGDRPLTRRSTGRQKRTAFGSLRCAPAPVTSALLAQAVSIFGGLSVRALASGLAAKPSMLVMAKAGKVAVGVGCQHHRKNGCSWRAPVARPSSLNGNRVGVVCALVPFAIRWVGASCSGESMQRWLPGETLVVTGH